MSSPVPTLPDGRPNFGAAAGGTDNSGMASIWNLPKDLAGKELWYDTGHHTVAVPTDPGTSASHSRETGPGSIAYKQRSVNQVNAYQILSSPEKILAQFAALSAPDPRTGLPNQTFMAIQKALASGPWGTVHLNGAFDQATETALVNAMRQYVKLSAGAGVGMSFTEYLLKTGEAAQMLGGDGTSLGGGQRQAPVINLTDPESIRQAAQSAAQAALGQGLSEDQLTKFVAQFQASQTTSQQAQGGQTSTAPDLSSQAMEFAQQENPQGYQQNQQQAFIDTLVNMFAPSQSQRPNMTPVPKA